MSRDYPAYPLPGVLAAVPRDGKLLLVQRAKESAPRRWGLPGGLIEIGERVTDAAIRELAEETGLVAEAGPVIDVFDMIVPDENGHIRTHYLVVVVLCRWIGGEPVAASDAAAAGWFTEDEISALLCHTELPRLAARLLRPPCAPAGPAPSAGPARQIGGPGT